MPTKGKLLSDYTSEQWERLRQSLVKPSLGYWLTLFGVTFLLLLSGISRLLSEGYTYEAILHTGAGLILVIFIFGNLLYRMKQRIKK